VTTSASRVPEVADLAAAVLDEEARRQTEQEERHAPVAIADDLLPGVGGEGMSLRRVLGSGGKATVGVLAGLVLVDTFDNSAFAVLGPDIQRSLHLSDLTLGVIGAIGGLLLFAAAVPLGYLGDRTRRTAVVGVCSAIWAAFAVVTGLAVTVWQLVVARILIGVGKANEQPIHSALLADAYPIQGRNRIYGIHRAAQPVGLLIGPLLAGGVAAIAGGGSGWRWSFVVLAVPAGVLAFVAFGLREPARGGHEQRAVLGEELAADEQELPVTVGAAFARLKKIKTFYAYLAALGALGFAFVAAPIYVNLVLKDHFDLGPGGRGVVGSLSAIGGVIGVVAGATYGDRLFRRSPAHSMMLTGALVGSFGFALAAALFMPNAALYTVFAAIANGLVFAAFVPTSGVIAAVTPYRLRSMGFATVGLYLSLIGGLGGAILVGTLAEAIGNRAAIGIVGPIASVIGGVLIAYGSRFVRADISAAAAELVEERDERSRIAAGGDLPMLQIRNLDFSYGPVQVLFNVNLDVRDGEVLALLGTNGAGKSTLLRAISGLGIAARGVIRLEGRTITLTEPRTRVGLGIVQVPGGKAVFPGLSVRENLAAGTGPFHSDPHRVAAATERVVSLFPVLAERMDLPAGTLSGGEQQMLGLAMSLVLEPKVLLIDELSLGLAPVVVQLLLETIERLKAAGLTIVIVEQSVNVALSIADRAVFMEKGQIRFEGPAAELLERDDLVRAVFLGRGGG
jgi:ABC-type branched-subunit amino acid transport system ATPase component/predicted MFS family arabinose efflux permease